MRLNTDEARARHLSVMRAVSAHIARTRPRMVLKGGSALMLGYGLTRFSVDLDYDASCSANRLMKFHTLPNTDPPRLKKDTDTVRRYHAPYAGPDGDAFLRVEISFRRQRIPSGEIVRRNGIRMYSANAIMGQKLNAAKARTRARDLFDIHFLATRHPDIGERWREPLADLFNNADRTLDRYWEDFWGDDLLVAADTDLVDIVGDLSEWGAARPEKGPLDAVRSKRPIRGPAAVDAAMKSNRAAREPRTDAPSREGSDVGLGGC